MKRFTIKVLGLLLAATFMFTGCAKPASPSTEPGKVEAGVSQTETSQVEATEPAAPTEKPKVKVMVSYDVSTMGAHYVDLWQKIADEEGIELEFENPGTDAYKTKIKVALTGDELPDIFSVWGGTYIDPFVQAGAVRPVQDILKSSGLNYKDSYLIPSPDGNNYVIPAKEEAYGVFYCNTELFDKIGVKIPTTWDELIDVVKATKDYNAANGTNYSALGLGIKDRWVGDLFYTMIVNRLDKDAFEKLRTGKIDFTDPVFAQAAEKALELVNLGAFPEGYIQTTSSEANEIFTTGQYLMYHHQSTLLTKFLNSDLKDKFEVVQFPDLVGDGAYAVNLMNGDDKIMPGICLSSKSEYPDAVAKLAIRFSEEVNKINMTQYGNPGYINDDSLKPEVDLSKASLQYAEMVNNAKHLTSYWFAAVDSNTGESWRDLVQQLLANGMSVKDFIEQGQSIFAEAKFNN